MTVDGPIPALEKTGRRHRMGALLLLLRNIADDIEWAHC